MAKKGVKYLYNAEHARQVEVASGWGMTLADCAVLIGVSQPLVNRHYQAECDRGKIRAHSQVARSLYRTATDWMNEKDEATGAAIGKPSRESVTAGCFIAKTQLGWRERLVLQDERRGSQPGDNDLSAASQEQIEAELRTLESRQAASSKPRAMAPPVSDGSDKLVH